MILSVLRAAADVDQERLHGHHEVRFGLLSARSAVTRPSELSKRFLKSLIVSAI